MERLRNFLIGYIFLASCWTGIKASGCQQDCSCGFRVQNDRVEDESITLKHEVLGGLCGAFGPLLLAAISYLIFKKCCSSPKRAQDPKSQSSPWEEENLNRGRGQGQGQGRPLPFQSNRSGHGPANRRVSTPLSMYSDADSEMPRIPPPYQAFQPLPTESQWRNIHKNVEGDNPNQWLKNVNKIKQFY